MGMKARRIFGMDTNSMKMRLLCTILAAGIFLTLAISMIGLKTFENTLISEIGNNRADVLRQIGDRVSQVKYNAYTLSNLYCYDHTLRSLLEGTKRGTAGSEQDFIRYMDRMTTQYKSSFHEDSMVFQVVLALEDGGGYSSEPQQAGYDYMSPKTKIWYKQMLFARGEGIDIANYKDKTTGKNYFSVARTIESEDGELLAYLMVNMDEAQIGAMYQSITEESRNTVYIVDDRGTIISCSNSKLNGFEFFNMKNLDRLFGKRDYTFTKMRGENILFTRYHDGDSGFTVLEEIPLAVLMEPIRKVRIGIIMLTVAAIGAAVLYASHFADRMSRPISQLCDFMLQVEEENLNQECTVAGYTEINILSKGLNTMLGRMRDLLQGIKQKEQQKRKMELSFLQAQINPHFMYNTLFSIKCMVDMEKNEEASKMLASFIQLLRSTLSNPDEFVTVRQEFHVLQQYIDIQQFRYDDGFQVVFECDEAAEGKKIPKLLVQPLLENAIFHGVEFKKGEGLIVITARVQEAKVMITVEDNGAGIAPEILEKIEAGEQLGSKTHVGIVNVKERIQLNFGENYGMQIESAQWEGTKIVLTLPALD